MHQKYEISHICSLIIIIDRESLQYFCSDNWTTNVYVFVKNWKLQKVHGTVKIMWKYIKYRKCLLQLDCGFLYIYDKMKDAKMSKKYIKKSIKYSK